MNTMQNVQRTIKFENDRHIDLLEKGEVIDQETRSFDAVNLRTISMRTKEDANDYRFFPEPDLQPLHVSKEQIAAIKAEMPILPKALFEKYTKALKLSDYDATNIVSTKPFAEYFEALIKHTKNYKSASNWMNGEVRSYLNQQGKSIEEFPIKAEKLAELIELIDGGFVSNSVAGH